ncbi:Ribonuclease P protein component [Smittium culicis]|uniref:Ribonuclease P protein component n=1 Tax=Smittium culicis TaxID=133412 RepID=A0A1R1WYN4_9FUNG|nr:Ribonuclease P protein component [Smittium culicis]
MILYRLNAIKAFARSYTSEIARARNEIPSIACKDATKSDLKSSFDKEKYFKPSGIKKDELGLLLNGKKCIIADSPLFFVKALGWRSSIVTNSLGNRVYGYRLSIVTSKKSVSQLAVIRNRARRRIRKAFQQLAPDHGKMNYDYLVVPKPAIVDAKWNDILDQVKKSLITLSKKIATLP